MHKLQVFLFVSGTAKQVGSDSNVDDVFNLMRSTGMRYEQGTKRPEGYPEKYFARVSMDRRDDSGNQWAKYISTVNQRLVSDDVYNQVVYVFMKIFLLEIFLDFLELCEKNVCLLYVQSNLFFSVQ